MFDTVLSSRAGSTGVLRPDDGQLASANYPALLNEHSLSLQFPCTPPIPPSNRLIIPQTPRSNGPVG